MGNRDKIALIGGGAALALFVLFKFALFPAWDSLQEVRENLPIQEKKLEKFREVVRSASLRSGEASRAEARLREAEGGLLTSKAAALASAELQEMIKQFTTNESIDVRSSDFAPVQPLGAEYAKVPLSMQFSCRMDQLVNLLRDIGGSPRYLSVMRFSIQPSNAKDKLVSVTMQVAAVMRAEPSKKESAK